MSCVKRFIAHSKIEDMRQPLHYEGIRTWKAVALSLDLSQQQSKATTQLWRSFRCVHSAT